ncbi:MAG: hypothetical protein SF066_21680 [Thermoanaerobaculia bacterium]|nr:hypothetical protein [Thermoanaerobaculia bacterium]
MVEGCVACRGRAVGKVVAWAAAEARRFAPELRRRQPRRSVSAAEAELGVARLRALPGWARRNELARLQHYLFRGSAMARALLAEARRQLPAEPEEAVRWAALVERAAGLDRRHYCSGAGEHASLTLRAALFQANAERWRGELEAAAGHFAAIADEARDNGVRDLAFWAEHRSFVASLRRASRDFTGVLASAHFAALYFGAVGDLLGTARTRLQIATIHEQLGEPGAALGSTREALAVLPAVDEPELRFNARHLEAAYLARVGRFAEASSAFTVLAPEYEARPWTVGYRRWTEGLIAAGLGRVTTAATAFRAARDVFIARENPYDGALVTLDWSLLLLDHGQAEEVLPLAVFMGQQFERLGVARETLASWAILRKAAERRELSRTVAESLSRCLGTERSGRRRKS